MLTLKPSLYKDRLIVTCKTASCYAFQLQRKHWWSSLYTTLYEVCSLDVLKFFLDELTVTIQSYSGPLPRSRVDKNHIYASHLENAFKCSRLEIIEY